MRVWWFISIIVCLFKPSYAWLIFPPPVYSGLDRQHYPGDYTGKPSRYVNGTSTMTSDPEDTPDYRIAEPHFLIKYEDWPKEMERPSRNSPPYHQSQKGSDKYWRKAEKHMGCYCCTVYRKEIVVSTCAVITSRHILTTATPTLLILRSYAHEKTLENIFGAWYDIDSASYNTSLYATPARIHVHPMYAYEHQVNVSHPIPAMYDLAVWATTVAFYGQSMGHRYSVMFCERAASSWSEYTSSTPRTGDVLMVAGYMFIKAYNRVPMPWFRYIVKTQCIIWPCPKSDWQWFHCVYGEYWGRFGFDSGGGLTLANKDISWRNDGMIGMCAFSLKLRSMQTTHYFTVVDTYPVLDFLYNAFLGLIKPVYLDDRFEDTRWSAPRVWWGEHIDFLWDWPAQKTLLGDANTFPKYRR